MQARLHEMYIEEREKNLGSGIENDGMSLHADALDPEWCHDRNKPRATMEQYVALVGEDVAVNLEGIARARMEKRPRQYQSDAELHQAYIQAVTVAGGPGDGGAEGDAEPPTEGPKVSKSFFEPLPWGLTSQEDMVKVLDFEHRLRLTPFAKELLALPCMKPGAVDAGASPLGDAESARHWRAGYAGLAGATEDKHLELIGIQVERMEVSHDDAELDVGGAETDKQQERGSDELLEGPARPASFSDQDVYKTPSAYISHLIASLPLEERLTRDQTLFMVRFAACCDDAWEDEKKPPADRKVHHVLLLGAGGSGKTHVVQKLVFKAVQFIWPAASKSEPTLMVVASSNAQAKNISTQEVKARTIHNAGGVRVQGFKNELLRPGQKQNILTKVWNCVRVLVIEEVSMVPALWYNMLDVRSMHGRSKTHDVYETTYRRPHHHFGRIPIVIHLCDFLQLTPTANISLIEDVNAKNEDGSYKHPEPPSVEVQHAIKVFGSIQHVFELRGTKRFKAGDPLLDFLECMRHGKRFPENRE